jgi:ABC-2 type transport system ATP-binding protein
VARVGGRVPAILAARLGKRYGRTDALHEVDLRVEAGRFFGLFGPNGAGKTTMLRILTGQLRPTSGEARVLDVDVVEEPLRVKALVGIVPEVESPPSYLTAYEYLYFVGRVRRLDAFETRIARWFDFFGLDENRTSLCKDLSKGTRQKLMLAAAFLHDPALVFLDEPFINLDPIYQRKLKDFLQAYVAGGGTVFMASHLLDIAEKLCDRVAVIRSGSIIASGTLDELRGREADLESAFLRLVGA